MVRLSKQSKIRAISPRRPAPPASKTGPIKDALPLGYKPHANAIQGKLSQVSFIPKIK